MTVIATLIVFTVFNDLNNFLNKSFLKNNKKKSKINTYLTIQDIV